MVVAWFPPYHNKPAKEDIKRNEMEIKTTLANISNTLPKCPRRTRMSQFYSRSYFPSKIRPVFEPLWAHEQNRVLMPGEKRLTQLQLTNNVVKGFWEKETPEFREWLAGEQEKEHQENITKYKQKMEAIDLVPDDAASFHR